MTNNRCIEKKPLIAITAAIFLLMFLSDCTRLSYDITPDDVAQYRSLRLKVNVKDMETGKRGSFKILLKYNRQGDKMFFLSPLNQIYGLLFVENEMTLLINTKKKKYWRGEFSLLLQFMWGEEMDFQFHQFKELMVSGVVPQDKLNKKNITVTVTKTKEGDRPERIRITNPDVQVKVKISEVTVASGQLRLNHNIKGMTQARLREVLE